MIVLFVIITAVMRCNWCLEVNYTVSLALLKKFTNNTELAKNEDNMIIIELTEKAITLNNDFTLLT